MSTEPLKPKVVRYVRATTAYHFAQIESLQRSIFPHDTPHPTDSGAWWLVFDGSIAVAFAGVVASTQWCDAAYLCRAGVAKTHRGQGIQKHLIVLRERQMRAQGMNWMITDTTANLASSNSLIAKAYRLFDPSKPWGPAGALYWRTRLSNPKRKRG